MRVSLRRAWRSEWFESVSAVLERCEAEEPVLAYTAEGEKSRRASGSYYTPVDVARFFWRNYFTVRGIEGPKAAREFVANHVFVEPSAGSGILFFALLEALGRIGLSPEEVQTISAYLVDVNGNATKFLRTMVNELRRPSEAILLSNVNVLKKDFLRWAGVRGGRAVMCFGNPPFVLQSGEWRNSAAEFMSRCMDLAGPRGSLSLIMPMSLCFSRDYRVLRERIRALKVAAYFANFDNIPDTLFKAGKPLNENTNKANSQRCSVVSLVPSKRTIQYSTRLIRWRASDRDQVLGVAPQYVRIDGYSLNDQFPRAQSEGLIGYLKGAVSCKRLRDLVADDGDFCLYIAGVARNYIGIRDEAGPGVLCLRVGTRRDFLKVLGIVTSQLFFEYWLAVGDGFHVTLGSVLDFPLSPEVEAKVECNSALVSRAWKERSTLLKTKLNRGVVVRSYDFTSRGLALNR